MHIYMYIVLCMREWRRALSAYPRAATGAGAEVVCVLNMQEHCLGTAWALPEALPGHCLTSTTWATEIPQNYLTGRPNCLTSPKEAD